MRALIIDCDVGRRAQLARCFYERGWHAEVFDSVDEFKDFNPEPGFVFAHENAERPWVFEQSKGERGSPEQTPVIMYSEEPDLELIVRAMMAGALDYFEWPLEDEKFDGLVTQAKQRQDILRKEQIVKDEALALVAQLSAREKQVITLITRGLSNKAIATDLDISPRTVEIHRANAFAKLNAASTADAVRIGVYAGLDREG